MTRRDASLTTCSYLDSAAFVKARINNGGILSLAYTQNLRSVCS